MGVMRQGKILPISLCGYPLFLMGVLWGTITFYVTDCHTEQH